MSKCEMPEIIDQLPDNELDIATVRPQTGCTNGIITTHTLKKKKAQQTACMRLALERLAGERIFESAMHSPRK